MARVTFAPCLRRHVACPPREAAGLTVRALLDAALEGNPTLRGYVLDEQGRLRKHMNVFIDGVMIGDRAGLSDAAEQASEVYVMQALSGG